MKGLPYMPYTANKAQQQTLQFGGVEYGKSGDDGSLSESMNLSARQFPALSQRTGRTVFGTYEKAAAIFGKGKLCVVDGTKFLYGGEEKGTVTEGEKQIASVNTKIVIWPDMVYYDTKEDKFGSIGDRVIIGANSATFTDNTLTVTEVLDGRKLEDVFAVNQAVEISNTYELGNDKELVIRGVEGNTLTFSENSFTPGTSDSPVIIKRRVPELKVICSSNNRLWGADDTTIWASALGDPLTWFNYDGLSTDSYSVAVGTDGPFTACCEYGSNVLFFKEDKLHKLIGSAPSEYAIYTYSIPGVQLGSMKSAQVIMRSWITRAWMGYMPTTEGSRTRFLRILGRGGFRTQGRGTTAAPTISLCRMWKQRNGGCGPWTRNGGSGSGRTTPTPLTSLPWTEK